MNCNLAFNLSRSGPRYVRGTNLVTVVPYGTRQSECTLLVAWISMFTCKCSSKCRRFAITFVNLVTLFEMDYQILQHLAVLRVLIYLNNRSLIIDLEPKETFRPCYSYHLFYVTLLVLKPAYKKQVNGMTADGFSYPMSASMIWFLCVNICLLCGQVYLVANLKYTKNFCRWEYV